MIALPAIALAVHSISSASLEEHHSAIMAVLVLGAGLASWKHGFLATSAPKWGQVTHQRGQKMKESVYLKISRRIRGYWREKSFYAYGAGYIADTPQGTFAVDPRDFWVTRCLLRDGCYDKRNIELLKDLLSCDSKVCFIGAHIGTLLVPISKHGGFNVQVQHD
ncbi:MAG: hypothetical protein R8K46_03485 [Mariprofundaceae bacterium]